MILRNPFPVDEYEKKPVSYMVCETISPCGSSYPPVEYPTSQMHSQHLGSCTHTQIIYQNTEFMYCRCYLPCLISHPIPCHLLLCKYFLICSVLSWHPSALAAVLYQLGPHQQDVERLIDLQFETILWQFLPCI